jgi:HSP20 family protein
MALPTRVSCALAAADPFEALHRDFDSVLNRFFNPEPATGLMPFGVDIREDADHIYVEAELPGFKKDEINVTLENQQLTIQAERSTETKKEEAKAQMLLQERRYGRYVRSFTLPPTVDESQVDAKLMDGVLTITLNKRDEVKPRKITVS